jgi:hypothetical protein
VNNLDEIACADVSAADCIVPFCVDLVGNLSYGGSGDWVDERKLRAKSKAFKIYFAAPVIKGMTAQKTGRGLFVTSSRERSGKADVGEC